ncbi:DUF1294 domain-containing protein [Alteromonas oceanisediminis]|uniref:DUF1294 domain-containing protein n=1 Tax=Alteromonas oceanisediminis TaxID=2836180 RepID=UPI001BDAAD31|nr:cold shock and DUF1294 domain-containing protein [Alteromonas oceanisediminis]MBT0588173.1 DUF1294 domain-containing protein [Alteromonas oceanisediminis]
MRSQGRLTNWNDDKGFGFVEPNGGGIRSFVHIKSFKKRSRRPVEGDLIVYEQIKDANGKYKAVNISLALDKKKQKRPSAETKGHASIIVILFTLSLPILVFLNYLPIEVLYLYCVASFIAFIAYALDKSAAKNGKWRTPESHLHLLSIIGGWPGAFYAQKKLRHKSSKKEFKQVYWAGVIINVCAFLWLLTEHGQQFLDTLVG